MQTHKQELGQRHRYIREEVLRLTVAEYSDLVGNKEVTIYSWESGRTSVPRHILVWLEREYQVSTSWMLTGEGSHIVEPPANPRLQQIEQKLLDMQSMIRTLQASSPDVLASARSSQTRPRIPLLSIAVSAGVPTASDDTIEREIDLAEMLLQHPESSYFIRVVGDSMNDAGICDGDTLIVDCALQPRPGQIVIAKVFGELTVKRYLLVDGIPLLRAENSSYKDIPVTQDMDFTIVGVVSSCIKSF